MYNGPAVSMGHLFPGSLQIPISVDNRIHRERLKDFPDMTRSGRIQEVFLNMGKSRWLTEEPPGCFRKTLLVCWKIGNSFPKQLGGFLRFRVACGLSTCVVSNPGVPSPRIRRAHHIWIFIHFKHFLPQLSSLGGGIKVSYNKNWKCNQYKMCMCVETGEV